MTPSAQRTSQTRVRLVRLRTALLAGALLMLVTSMWAVQIVQGTAETVRDRTTEAVLETAAARAALTAADQAAIASFASDEVALTGPGQDYTNQLATANQSLAKVAEANQAEGAGAGRLQVVAGLLAAYSSAIGQADAHYRQPGAKTLGAADLWYASRLLHSSDGVLEQLSLLQADQRLAMVTQLDEGSPALPPLWLLPVSLLVPVVLLGLLGLTQWRLYRWFRRRLNLPLLAASVVTGGLVVALIALLGQQSDLDDVRTRTDVVLADRQAEVAENDADGQRLLAGVLTSRCELSGCGVTVADFQAKRQAGGPGAAPELIDTDTQRVVAAAETAAESGGRELTVPAAVLAVGGLVLLGLYRRIDEYRYHA